MLWQSFAVGVAEKIFLTKYATFEASFLCCHGQKMILDFFKFSARTEKLHAMKL